MRKIDEILKNERIWGHEAMWFMAHSAWVKLPDCGTCSVIWSDNEDGYEHVSVSPKKQFRILSWDDMCVLKDIFFSEEEEAYQIHPKKSQYVNGVKNCLHLWKPKGHEIDELTKLENQSRWIPVSERLPKPGKRYLVTVKWEDGEWSKLSVYDAVYGKDEKWHGDNYEPFKYCEVLAWMPLPEPWKGE